MNMREKYTEIKKEYPALILLFEESDIIIAFDSDAVILAEVMNLELKYTAGYFVTVMSCDLKLKAISGLIAKGYRLAICTPLTN